MTSTKINQEHYSSYQPNLLLDFSVSTEIIDKDDIVSITERIVRDNLETEFGKELMTNRSIFAEGTFGCIKEDNRYVRLFRRGNAGVKMEITLITIGHNFRKYHAKLDARRNKEEMAQLAY